MQRRRWQWNRSVPREPFLLVIVLLMWSGALGLWPPQPIAWQQSRLDLQLLKTITTGSDKELISTMFPFGKVILTPTRGGDLIALDPKTGRSLWNASLGFRNCPFSPDNLLTTITVDVAMSMNCGTRVVQVWNGSLGGNQTGTSPVTGSNVVTMLVAGIDQVAAVQLQDPTGLNPPSSLPVTYYLPNSSSGIRCTPTAVALPRVNRLLALRACTAKGSSISSSNTFDPDSSPLFIFELSTGLLLKVWDPIALTQATSASSATFGALSQFLAFWVSPDEETAIAYESSRYSLMAISPVTGEALWNHSLSDPVVSSSAGYLNAVRMFSYQIPNGTGTAAATGNSVCMILATEHQLRAFSINGDPLATFSFPDNILDHKLTNESRTIMLQVGQDWLYSVDLSGLLPAGPTSRFRLLWRSSVKSLVRSSNYVMINSFWVDDLHGLIFVDGGGTWALNQQANQVVWYNKDYAVIGSPVRTGSSSSDFGAKALLPCRQESSTAPISMATDFSLTALDIETGHALFGLLSTPPLATQGGTSSASGSTGSSSSSTGTRFVTYPNLGFRPQSMNDPAVSPLLYFADLGTLVTSLGSTLIGVREADLLRTNAIWTGAAHLPSGTFDFNIVGATIYQQRLYAATGAAISAANVSSIFSIGAGSPAVGPPIPLGWNWTNTNFTTNYAYTMTTAPVVGPMYPAGAGGGRVPPSSGGGTPTTRLIVVAIPATPLGINTKPVLTGIDAETGQSLWWGPPLGSSIQGAVVLESGVVCYGDAGDSYFGIDAANGTLKWNYDRNSNGWGLDSNLWTVGTGDGIVIFGGSAGIARAVVTSTGQSLWNLTFPGTTSGVPLQKAPVIIPGSPPSSHGAAAESGSGSAQKSFNAPEGVAPDSWSETQAFFCHANHLYQVAVPTGTLLWYIALNCISTPTYHAATGDLYVLNMGEIPGTIAVVRVDLSSTLSRSYPSYITYTTTFANNVLDSRKDIGLTLSSLGTGDDVLVLWQADRLIGLNALGLQQALWNITKEAGGVTKVTRFHGATKSDGMKTDPTTTTTDASTASQSHNFSVLWDAVDSVEVYLDDSCFFPNAVRWAQILNGYLIVGGDNSINLFNAYTGQSLTRIPNPGLPTPLPAQGPATDPMSLLSVFAFVSGYGVGFLTDLPWVINPLRPPPLTPSPNGQLTPSSDIPGRSPNPSAAPNAAAPPTPSPEPAMSNVGTLVAVIAVPVLLVMILVVVGAKLLFFRGGSRGAAVAEDGMAIRRPGLFPGAGSGPGDTSINADITRPMIDPDYQGSSGEYRSRGSISPSPGSTGISPRVVQPPEPEPEYYGVPPQASASPSADDDDVPPPIVVSPRTSISNSPTPRGATIGFRKV
jgi:outer membrane protein assembly factor BamB